MVHTCNLCLQLGDESGRIGSSKPASPHKFKVSLMIGRNEPIKTITLHRRTMVLISVSYLVLFEECMAEGRRDLNSKTGKMGHLIITLIFFISLELLFPRPQTANVPVSCHDYYNSVLIFPTPVVFHVPKIKYQLSTFNVIFI